MTPDLEPSLGEKKARLDFILDEMGSVLVAYSGGVDSAYLLHAAFGRLGSRAAGLIAVSPSLPRAELEEARQVARDIGCHLEIAGSREHENPEYQANNPDRCYFCKTELFDVCRPAALRLNLDHVAYGANVDDLGDFRPGMKAAREQGVRAPLLEAGLKKDEIRELSREAGLRTWDKPSFACLASRIPHGTAVTVERLGRIEKAESFLRSRGFRQFRVRDLNGRARVEVPPEDIDRLSGPELLGLLFEHLTSLGFREVIIDPEGYRSGKLHAAGGVSTLPGPPSGSSLAGAEEGGGA